MRIEIRLCSSLARIHPSGAAFSVTLPAQATIADALLRIGLQPDRLSMVLCNGESAVDSDGDVDGSRALREGDHLVVASDDPAAHRALTFARFNPLRHLNALLSPLLAAR